MEIRNHRQLWRSGRPYFVRPSVDPPPSMYSISHKPWPSKLSKFCPFSHKKKKNVLKAALLELRSTKNLYPGEVQRQGQYISHLVEMPPRPVVHPLLQLSFLANTMVGMPQGQDRSMLFIGWSYLLSSPLLALPFAHRSHHFCVREEKEKRNSNEDFLPFHLFACLFESR